MDTPHRFDLADALLNRGAANGHTAFILMLEAQLAAIGRTDIALPGRTDPIDSESIARVQRAIDVVFDALSDRDG